MKKQKQINASILSNSLFFQKIEIYHLNTYQN